MTSPVNATWEFQPGYWEVDMHDPEIGSFSEVVIPVEPTVGMLINAPEGGQFRITEVLAKHDCDLVEAMIEWVF